MNWALQLVASGFIGLLATASAAHAQNGAYIGFVYPAGGQQGQTFQIRLGGQRIDGVDRAIVTGEGVEAKVVKYYRKLNNQELTLMREQLRELQAEQKALQQKAQQAAKRQQGNPQQAKGQQRQVQQVKAQPAKVLPAKGQQANQPPKPVPLPPEKQKIMEALQYRIGQYVNNPACAALSSIVVVEVTIAPDAKPGKREIRLVARQGVTNPMPFYVGQVPEVARKPMKTWLLPILGKEQLAQRNRPEEEIESRITIPCTVNGQVAAGEVNRYRFDAKKGQQLVISTKARELVPYIADAVPGWFQPVITLFDADGNEVAYNDDFRFKPDPTLSCTIPKDGEYVLEVHDAIYRGREDFVYRITIGEQPFVTNIFPLGGRVGETTAVQTEGWNLGDVEVAPPSADAKRGIYYLTATTADGQVSNAVPFVLDWSPECLDEGPNDKPMIAQKVKLPITVNGRIDRQDDWDVFQFNGRAGETVVAEVLARRLDSPLDSMLKITDSKGRLLAMNDDHFDVGSGANTHHADSYIMFTLPSDGVYYVHLGDTARCGGKEYAYRLRISRPRPDFELRAVPVNTGIRKNGATRFDVYAIRKDGFDRPIKLTLHNPPEGFQSWPVVIQPNQGKVSFNVKTTLASTAEPVSLQIKGQATIGDRVVTRTVIPAEDRMQAFLWRHLVPFEELMVTVYDPQYQAPPVRIPAEPDLEDLPQIDPDAVPMFTKNQVAGRLRQLKLLFEEYLLTDEFYNRKVAECEASL